MRHNSKLLDAKIELDKLSALLKNNTEQLEQERTETKKVLDRLVILARNASEAEKKTIETLSHFDDLKSRLLTSERQNEFLRGYLARVQEDDVVREELIATGNEDEKLMVPKRKHTAFLKMNDEKEYGESDNGYFDSRRQIKRKNWVAY